MEGGWAKLLEPVQLTGSGRAVLGPSEVECQLLPAVDLQIEGQTDARSLKSGVATLTTHRILWVDEHCKYAGAVPLPSICRMFPPKKTIKNMFATPRLRLQLWITADGRLLRQGSQAAAGSILLTLIFRGQAAFESFVQLLADNVQAKAWESDVPAATGKPASLPQGRGTGHPSTSSHAGPSRVNAAMAGVSGILRKEQEQWDETDKSLQDAFQDLNALMGKAKEMVLLAERMRAKLLASTAGQAGQDDVDVSSKQDIQDWLLSVGIASPVTKESAGALYHQQLSRQLADFIKVSLQRSGGMLAMVDAYCIFNRARGTELISPEDLLQACMIWEKIDVPVTVRRFDSGVMVIQFKNQSDDEVFAKLTVLAKKQEAMKIGIGPNDCARELGVAPALAKEQLLAAESRGLLCRDDGPDGLRFFVNLFKDMDVRSIVV